MTDGILRDVSFRGFRFDASNRCWSFRPAGRGAMSVESAGAVIDVNGRSYSLRDADVVEFRDRGRRKGILGERRIFSFTFNFQKPVSFAWTLQYEVPVRGNTLIIGSSVKNLSPAPVMLGALDLVAAGLKIGPNRGKGLVYQFKFIDSTLQEGPNGEPVKSLPWGGNNSMVKRLDSDKGHHDPDEILMIYNPTVQETFLSAFVTFDSVRARHSLDISTRKRVADYRAYCDFMGNELLPGHTFKAEELLIRFSDDPYRALEEWADTVRRLYRPRLPRETPVGWVGWSWVDLMSSREPPAETVILENAAAIRKRLRGFDVDYIWISLVNLKDMIPGNWLEFNREHFPRGVHRALKKLTGMGFKPGFWSSPFWVFDNARKAVKANRRNFLRHKDGSTWKLRLGWPFTNITPSSDGRFTVDWLDGSHPRTLKFLRRVTEAYRRMGIQYYLLDFLCEPVGVVQHNRKMTWRQAERAVVQEMKEAAGPDTFLITGVGSSLHYVGCADSMRISADYGEGRALYPPFRDHFNATFALHDDLVSGQKNLLRDVAANYFTHRKLYLNNCNVITVDKPVPRRHAEITLTVFGLSGSPIMLGDDIRRIDEERLGLIKKCLPQTPEMAFPVDLFTSVYPDDYPRVLMRRVDKPWETYVLVAVFNIDATPYRKTLDMKDLGLDTQRSYLVYDFWGEEYMGTVSGQIDIQVPACSVKLLRLAPARTHPWLLSTDMHIQQGNVEITRLKWDARKLTLSGTATRPQGETGSLYFLMPPGYRLVKHEGHWLMKDARDSCVVIRKEIQFVKSKMTWSLRFGKFSPPTA